MNNTRKWPGGMLVGFGVANVAFAVAGLALTIPVILSFHRTFGPSPNEPYFSQAFFVMSSVNVIFDALLGLAGVYLIRRRLRAVTFSNILFPLEIVYFISLGALWLSPSIGISVGAATGIANMGLSLQMMTGYPIIALIGLNIARAKYRRTNSPNDPA